MALWYPSPSSLGREGGVGAQKGLAAEYSGFVPTASTGDGGDCGTDQREPAMRVHAGRGRGREPDGSPGSRGRRPLDMAQTCSLTWPAGDGAAGIAGKSGPASYALVTGAQRAFAAAHAALAGRTEQ